MQLEEVKNNLVTTSPEGFQRLQGEAGAFQKLIRQMERKSLSPELIKEK